MMRIFVGVALSLAINSPIGAQAVAAAMPRQTVAQPLAPRITVAFDEIPLAEAIRVISQRSGVLVSFAPSLLPAKRVTYRATNVLPSVVLASVLRGTGVRAEQTTDGTFRLVTAANANGTKAQGTITGRVIEASTKQPIVGATVQLEGTSHRTQTGDDGTFRITDIPAGTHTLVVRRIGYGKLARSVTVGENGTATMEVSLEASANALDQVVVTGTVTQTELKAVPSAITIVTAKQIEERGITRIDQLFRGDIPGVFAVNLGTGALLDEVTMYSRGPTALASSISSPTSFTNPIKTYVDGIEMADSKFLSQLDPRSIERIEILTGPQASTIYGANAINGVMQIFTKRGSTTRPQLTLNLMSGFVQNNFSSALTPQHDYNAQLSGIEGRFSYNAGGSWNYMGPWTPAKQLARTGGFVGARLDLPTPAGQVTADVTLRRSATQSVQRGNTEQLGTGLLEQGWYGYNFGTWGLSQPITRTLGGQTHGVGLTYAPTSWWSHELGMGIDVSDVETRYTGRGYTSISDTALSFRQQHADRRSLRYATTARIPLNSFVQVTLTAGADGWQSLESSSFAQPQTLSGTLTNVSSVTRQPGHNTGGFFQSQIGLTEHLFITYGIRAEKNPTIGEKASVVPGRYGIAYTQEFGPVTAKLRGSYGRSIRPPLVTRKDAVPVTDATAIALYGPHLATLANPELAPEQQQGGEGGLELYLGTRGSLVVTRYNQTVDQLITFISSMDSVRSLAPCPVAGCSSSSTFRDADGHAFRYQRQYLNLGSIRNQGWEMQGSLNLGPLATRGTYSWTKSRVIGITPKYSAFFAGRPEYQPGATFRYLPEHTWAFGVTYATAHSSVGLNATGLGRVTTYIDEFYLRHIDGDVRLQQGRYIYGNSGAYINHNQPYSMVDLTASHRFTSTIEGLLQVQNLGDRYMNEYYSGYASIGRQLKVGGRVRTR